ncbi:hypothetical protein SDC9_76458 [bioreactor metagenome]|uniref:Uncharacterized protein n=1 Tax=bioreactor metagenome TaxID=1076179 RepID=A0A644YN29_9ZZZZ
MARSVHHIDLHVLVADSGIFRQNRDAALPLQIAGVHNPLHDLLILAVYAALFEHLVHQGRLAVVNVGNDGNVSQLFILHICFFSFCMAGPQ